VTDQRPKTAFFAPRPLDDPGRMPENPQQTMGAWCTCTGGPYVHGPEGLRQFRQEIQDAHSDPQSEEEPDRG
jgi:hypothetical protein